MRRGREGNREAEKETETEVRGDGGSQASLVLVAGTNSFLLVIKYQIIHLLSPQIVNVRSRAGSVEASPLSMFSHGGRCLFPSVQRE
mmetsp:Transcript_35636/g.74600  ORF Transcript_35636/g.74600 Transcript_35636/m.74600 type:complete len:87 (-) Transcript_35636:500-760(-)